MTPAALGVALAIVGTIVVLAVTATMNDPDMWQHLLVGRAMWQLHSIPRTNLWTWPTHGAPYVLPSWLFRVMLWPFWAAGGLTGLFVWRWLTTLAAFALLWRTARRAGATGVAPLVLFAWCALFYRQRSQLRPDSLVAVLLALELWLLESRRNGRAIPLAWLALVGWAWVNAHISYPLFFLVAGAYLLDALWRARPGSIRRGDSPRALALATAVTAALAFLNPFGWETLRQPFDYVLHWRHEPIYQSIVELRGLDWAYNARNGFAAFCAVAFVLALVRAVREGPDFAEWLLVPALLAQTISSQRFIGYFALVAAPFAARDLASALSGVRWPRLLAAPLTRSALAGAAALALAIPELARPGLPIAIGLAPFAYPVHACDWMARHGVRGRGFSPFYAGGYLLWRFWPDPGRLPFMDIHQTGTPHDRDLYAYAWADRGAWNELDAERRFDWVILFRHHGTAAHLLDYLDSDPNWALVFADDAAALFLKRGGSMAALADSAAYTKVPAGDERLSQMASQVEADPQFRDETREELRRQIADSPLTGQARSQLANLEALDGRWASALGLLQQAGHIDPDLPRLAEREDSARQHLATERGTSR
jgi:hypothetical protein